MQLPHPCNGIDQWTEATTETFAGIYKRHYDPLVFFARKFLSDPLVAEDIVTELFLKFWQKQAHFSSPYAVRTFLYISTRNACINHNQRYRKQARAIVDLRMLTDELEESILHTITRSEILRDVYSSVESLPVQCRKIVLLSYLGGLSNKQIARHLQLSVHTVKNQKVRGINLVRGKVLHRM
jgi:RNA polymerase sigma-70 factor (ECF subfamily)